MNKILKAILFMAVLLFSCCMYFFVSAGTNIKITVNGKSENIGATRINNKVYVDLEDLSKLLSYNVKQNQDTIHISHHQDIIPDIIKEVSPSVVGIIGNTDSSNSYQQGISLGTGIVIKSGGEILTNAHVVENMSKIITVLSDGTGYEARIKYMDQASDLAVIKIDKIGLTAAKFGDLKDVVTGKTVIAIGTPISFQNRNSASVGVISGLNRSIDGFYRYKLIQTDTAINPGNSGGPLVNTLGEVIGINSISTLNAQGLNYAIPVDTINFVLDHFYKYGKVKRVTLGADFEEDVIALYGLPSKTGLKITNIEKGACAEKYGLKENDYIHSINSVSVNTIVDLNEALKGLVAGDKVKAGIRRNGSNKVINIVLDEFKN